MDKINATQEQLADAFNRWMDDYINNPEQFEHMTKTVLEHEKQKNNGEDLSYGQETAAMLIGYLDAE